MVTKNDILYFSIKLFFHFKLVQLINCCALHQAVIELLVDLFMEFIQIMNRSLLYYCQMREYKIYFTFTVISQDFKSRLNKICVATVTQIYIYFKSKFKKKPDFIKKYQNLTLM